MPRLPRPIVNCPHCGVGFKLVKSHITKTHDRFRVEVRKIPAREGEEYPDFRVRILRGGVVVGDVEWEQSNGGTTYMNHDGLGHHEGEYVWRDETKREGEKGDYLMFHLNETKNYADGESPEGWLYMSRKGKEDITERWVWGEEDVGHKLKPTIVFVE
jgi:hypothetical protein